MGRSGEIFHYLKEIIPKDSKLLLCSITRSTRAFGNAVTLYVWNRQYLICMYMSGFLSSDSIWIS